MEKDLILEKNDDIVETFNDFFFTCVISNLNVPRYQDPFIDSDQTENQIEHLILRIIEQYKNHPNIITINQNMDGRFSFQEITKSEINQEDLNLDSCKACQESDLPTKIIKANSDIFTEVIHKERNRGLKVDNFPCTLKLANATP